ncbi:MAG: SDR family oxidoreductase [bacterium]|nr:SDR family oxidoreductase [bacterium]
MNKNKIVITGALGHIGSALIRNLPKGASEVFLLDNLSSQRYPSLFDLPPKPILTFFEGDIRTAEMEKYTEGAKILVHLAAITNAEGSFDRQKEVEDVNFEGLKKVADACLKTGTKLIFPSSTSVYGSQSALVDETCSELVPQSPYADSKLKAEEYLKSLKEKGLKFVVCRFGTIFGWSVGMRFHTAVNKFIWQAVNGLPITVWKTAWEQKRPYLDLSDCVSAIHFLIENDLFDGEIYNILTKNFTVKDIAEAIKRFTPSLKVAYVDSKIMNQLSYDVSDAKIRSKGFLPEGDLEKRVGETVKKLEGVKI